jgi:CubicO group peptidase (beta-lactamase class C family)
MNPDLNVSFRHQGVNYDIKLVQGQKSDQSVQINGISYTVLGDAEKLETACKILRSLSLDTVSSSQDLADRLSMYKDVTFASTERIDTIGIKTLSNSLISKSVDESERTTEKIGLSAWMKKDLSLLPHRQELVAQGYWDMYISNGAEKDHSMLIGFLKSIPNGPENLEELFIKSINSPKDFALFLSLFRHLSTDNLHAINNGERLNAPMVSLTNQPVKITQSFVEEVKELMRDTNFSGVVALSDGDSVHTITVDKLNQPNAPFAMHSVGKMFTGALMLRLIEEKIISEKALTEFIQLDDRIIKDLPPAVSEQLSKTTLHDVMLHYGRYGDYLGNYQDDIDKALKENSSIPQINEPKDFLLYADRELIPEEDLEPVEKDGPKIYKYSNLGILLVGLSIEHLYNKYAEENSKEKLTYSEILNHYVIKPARMETFEVHMPEGARVNPEDQLSSHISGGPAGGYWSTTGDLLKFGKWLGDESKKQNFMRLLDSYGGEFYKNRDISHSGSIESASAHVSHRIDNGLTIAVMSDMTGLGEASKLAQKIQEHLLG